MSKKRTLETKDELDSIVVKRLKKTSAALSTIILVAKGKNFRQRRNIDHKEDDRPKASKVIESRIQCSICLEPVFSDTSVSLKTCGVCFFHEQCISNWLKEPNKKCPNCRRS